MSKPIFLTAEYIDRMVAEFRANISDAKMSDGKISFTKSFDYKDDDNSKAHVFFTTKAYAKMLALLSHFDTEVAWHGTVTRKDDCTFVITDIVVYPQTVTGATVNTDQEEYQKWIMGLDDDFFNTMRMQAHSHVNMGTTPSGVDTNHQQQILSQLKDNDYYIFMIYNKRLEHTIRIFDYANNILYEDRDIVVGIADEGFDSESFIAESDGLVKHKVFTPSHTSYNGSYEARSAYDEEYDIPDFRRRYTHSEAFEGYGDTPVKKDTGDKKSKAKKATTSKKISTAAQNQLIDDTRYNLRSAQNASVDWDREIFGDRKFDI